MANEIVGVIGAGTMGAGIAQVALEAGHEVVLNDVDEAAIERGRFRIREGLARRAARLDLDADSIDAWVDGRLDRLRDGHSLDAVGAEADVVVEAALENMDLKRTIFRTLDAAVGERKGVILATNTSALSVGAIAEATTHPGRVVGLHFFNPAPVMALVEVVAHDGSDPIAVDRAVRLVDAWGKVPVRSTDSPGFIVNRVNRPFTLEALAALDHGEAGVVAIDDAVRAAGYPMGPFELMDLVGIDVNLAAARGVWEGFGKAERFRPSSIQERLVDEGRLGRKAGSGFYRYEEGSRVAMAFDHREAGTGDAADVARRIELAVIAEAWRSIDDGIATAADIDTALRFGAGHPAGPFERTRALGGPAAVATSLAELESMGPRFAIPNGLRI